MTYSAIDSKVTVSLYPWRETGVSYLIWDTVQTQITDPHDNLVFLLQQIELSRLRSRASIGRRSLFLFYWYRYAFSGFDNRAWSFK
ncbi:uncharacterized protein PHALS_10408 [Plasmopara halstedii]|uniref:Uncharacterized protein n=1 Tax=Plasmopara halstedii TaxID=4781 RepID=A0A0P1AGD0_PLAHL|nr:uncharacterized protein PHALS_10408 [Plasmopara halstedii]CEG40196.1 hypothetical protein PHALS_10408 [Plasmopara halstedii]|eukprot:XP_024576565.1 hypothetical protein PHALS_10408 [Plasmopara halstedii]